MEKIVVDKSAFSESCQKHDFGSKNYKKAHFNRPKMKRKKKKKSYFGVCGGSSKPNLCKLKLKIAVFGLFSITARFGCLVSDFEP